MKQARVPDDGWRLPAALWAKMTPLLPVPPARPLGCHNPRVADRPAMPSGMLLPTATVSMQNDAPVTGTNRCHWFVVKSRM